MRTVPTAPALAILAVAALASSAAAQAPAAPPATSPAAAPAAGRRILTIIGSTFDGKRCTIDLGWEADVGVDSRTLEKRLAEKHPGVRIRDLTQKDNFKKDEPLGRHLVVVSATVKNAQTACTAKWYGVGFGADEAAAQKDARKHLGKRSVWLQASDVVTVEHSRAY